MNLHRMLVEREAMGKPLRVGVIGAGKFGIHVSGAGAANARDPPCGAGRPLGTEGA